MRAVIVRCPNCNANLQVESTVYSTTCQYCGTVSRIQARTAMFQIPKAPAMPKQASTMTNAERIAQLQQLAKMPVAVQRASLVLVLLPFLLMAAIGAGVFFAVNKAGGIGGITGSNKMMWAGHPPALVDVDGDGTLDVIGLSRYVQDNDRATFSAYNGKTGDKLWETESLGKYGDLSQEVYGAVGDTLYISTKDGKLIARNAKSKGVVKWEISLGEKIDTMCALGKELALATADSKWWIIDASGKKREGLKLTRLVRDYTNDGTKEAFERAGGEAGEVCMPLGWDHRVPPGVIALPGFGEMANVEGMNIEVMIKRPGGPTIAVGKKRPGTAVPLLARLNPKPAPQPMPKKGYRDATETRALLATAAWKIEIPASDPLNARLDEKHVALSDNAVFALYEISSSKHRLAAFSIADGKRLWDRDITYGSSFVPVSLTIVGDAVGITTWQNFTAYSVADGTERYQLGDKPY